jgi:hypothetical protein
MKRILKKTLTPLLALTMALGIGFSITNNNDKEIGAKAAPTVHDWIAANQGFTNGQDLVTTGPISVDSNWQMTFAQNSSTGNPKYYTSGSSVRLYADKTNGNGGSFTVQPTAANTNKVLTKFELKARSSYNRPFNVWVGDDPNNLTPISNPSYSNLIYTYQNSTGVKYIKFQNAQTGNTNQLHFEKITFTYDVSGGGAPVTYDSLSYTGTPITSYTAGDSFDPTGLTFNANFSDGTSQDVTSLVTFTPTVLATTDTFVTASHTIGTVTQTVDITGLTVAAAPVTLSSLTHAGTLTKTSYTAGETFDPTGLTFTATFSDNTSQTIAHTDLVFSPTPLSTGTTSVSASYTYDGVTKSTTITGITVSALAGNAATYTVVTKTSVNETGTVPTGSSADFINTSPTQFQITGGNYQLLTLSSYNSIRITSITLSVRSNQDSGAGYFAYSYDDVNYTDIIANSGFNTANWNGAFSTTYVSLTKSVDILAGGTIYFKMFATTNSLYCQSYTFHWDSVPTGTLQSLNISKPTVTIYTGLTDTLIATPVPANADGSVTWSTNSPSIATVNASGVVTAISPGTAIITATSTVNTNIKVTSTVTVNDVVEYTKITSTASLKFGSTFTFAAIGTSAGVDYNVAAKYEPSTTTHIQKYDATFNPAKTVITDEDQTLRLLLEPGIVNDSFAFKVIANGKYICQNADNNRFTFETQKTLSEQSSWKITFDTDGNALINSVSHPNRYIQYNANSGDERFSSYKNTQKKILMFVNLTTQTVMNEATCYANEIMSGYGLGAHGECAKRVGVLDNDYSRLSAAAQAEYNSNTSELFVNARARKAYMDEWVLNNPSAPLLSKIKTNDSTSALVVISIFGISAIAGYYFFIKKKKFKL